MTTGRINQVFSRFYSEALLRGTSRKHRSPACGQADVRDTRPLLEPRDRRRAAPAERIRWLAAFALFFLGFRFSSEYSIIKFAFDEKQKRLRTIRVVYRIAHQLNGLISTAQVLADSPSVTRPGANFVSLLI